MLNTAMIIIIAIIYNIFIHAMITILYKNLPYHEKQHNGIVFMIVAGIFGIIIAKMYLDKNEKYKNSNVSKGIAYGGILLIITGAISNWEKLDGGFKLLISGTALFLVIWLSYKYKGKMNTNKTVDHIK